MSWAVPWLLLIHVGGVMIGLGPTFVFPRINRQAAGSAHARFATLLVREISSNWTRPIMTVVFLSGAALIWASGYDLLRTPWLLASIVIFVPSYSYSALVQSRELARILDLTAGGTADLPPEAAAELAQRRRRARYGSYYMRASALAILVLMIVKPF